MKRTRSVFLILNLIIFIMAFGMALTCQAESIKSGYSIYNVTVYPKGANINSIVRLQVPKGISTIVIEPLPGTLDKDSLMVSIEDKQGISATILDIELTKRYLLKTQDINLRQLKEKLEVLEEKRSEQQAALDVIKKQSQLIDTLSLGPGASEGRCQPDPKYIQKILSLSFDQRKELSQQALEVKRKIKEIQKEIELLKKKIHELEGPGKDKGYELSLKIKTETAGMLTATLSYFVYQASWTPLYSIRADLASSKINLNYMANITQKSGEHWKDVKLLVSTATPSTKIVVPDVHPWYVDFPQPLFRLPMKVKEEKADRMLEMESVKSIKQQAFQTSKVKGAAITFFQVPHPVSIPGDGSRQTVALRSSLLDATFSYKTAPVAIPGAYLMAEIINKTGAPILPGKARVFIEGTYTGETNLQNRAENERFQIPFGRDYNIKVERKLVKKMRKKAGFVNKEKSVSYVFLITIENNRNKKITLEVLDRIPVSRNKEIKIQAFTEPKTQITDEGIVKWKLDLAPKEEIGLKLGYTISYPTDKELILP